MGENVDNIEIEEVPITYVEMTATDEEVGIEMKHGLTIPELSNSIGERVRGVIEEALGEIELGPRCPEGWSINFFCFDPSKIRGYEGEGADETCGWYCTPDSLDAKFDTRFRYGGTFPPE
ncbi:hypothetical protein [Haladaptatus sp. NG-WS-4]